MPRAADDIGALARIAAEVGVEHIVLLSARGEKGAMRSEERLRRAPLDHTILRASWFAQNFSEGAFLDGIIAGDLALPAGDVREPFVSVDDIADAAVEALCDPAHIGRTYEITGPRLAPLRRLCAAGRTGGCLGLRNRLVPVDSAHARSSSHVKAPKPAPDQGATRCARSWRRRSSPSTG